MATSYDSNDVRMLAEFARMHQEQKASEVFDSAFSEGAKGASGPRTLQSTIDDEVNRIRAL